MSMPVVPGYTVGGLLGIGASSQVWRATRDVDALQVALKVIDADASGGHDPSREIAVLERARHPHLVQLHDYLALPGGRVMLVLQLAEGGNLAQLVGARGFLTPGELVTLTAPLATTLADLHLAGVVHADVCPSNVLFCADGRPLLGDLGTARIAGDSDQDSFASAGFVAPEVVAGERPSPAADVYALCAVAWYALAGSAPAHPVIREALTTVAPGVSPVLAQIVEAGLDGDKERRPEADALARAVFDATAPEPLALSPSKDPGLGLTHRIRAAVADDAAQVRTPPQTGLRRLFHGRRRAADTASDPQTDTGSDDTGHHRHRPEPAWWRSTVALRQVQGPRWPGGAVGPGGGGVRGVTPLDRGAPAQVRSRRATAVVAGLFVAVILVGLALGAGAHLALLAITRPDHAAAGSVGRATGQLPGSDPAGAASSSPLAPGLSTSASPISSSPLWSIPMQSIPMQSIPMRSGSMRSSSQSPPRSSPSPQTGDGARAWPSPPPESAGRTRGGRDVRLVQDAPRTEPLALIQSLVQARAAAWRLRRPGLLEAAYARGSPAIRTDRTALQLALRLHARYRGLSFTAVSARADPGWTGRAPGSGPGSGPGSVQLTAELRTSAYQVLAAGRSLHRPSDQAATVLHLAWTTAGWRIIGWR